MARRSSGNARRPIATNIASCRGGVDLEREGVPGISVVIPTLNEADSLVETVRRAKASPEVSEVIVVDAGSQDRTKAIAEELGCRLVLDSIRPLGEFEAIAANEPGRRVHAGLYGIDVTGDIAPGQEIDETVWVDPASPPDIVLAPFTRDHVLPLASTRLHDQSGRSAEKLLQPT